MVTNDKYLLRVADTGQGIAADGIPTLFDHFQRASQATGEGYGLGLSIVKSQAYYHNMILAVDAVEGGRRTLYNMV